MPMRMQVLLPAGNVIVKHVEMFIYYYEIGGIGMQITKTMKKIFHFF